MTGCDANPYHADSACRASATQLASKLRSREISALDVVDSCLERIAERDSDIHAWTSIDPAYARAQARALDSGPVRGPLHGIPIAVKDIIATAKLPTEYGSPIYAGHIPASDAACVSAALAAGVSVIALMEPPMIGVMEPLVSG